MKNILLMLLLANILYFLWGLKGEEEKTPGVAIIAGSDLGPPLEVAEVRESSVAASPDPAPSGSSGSSGSSGPSGPSGSTGQTELQAVVGRSCVTVGPFTERADADYAETEYSQQGMDISVRATEADMFVGHWVWIRNIADETQARSIMEGLRVGGLTDAYIDRNDPEGLKISLGLFGEVERAERIELQARSMDYPAEIIPSTREREVFFVDIGLPPGKGAGAIVEKHGQDRVLMRDAATCP